MRANIDRSSAAAVESACRAALWKFHGNAAEAARAYGLDVRKMIVDDAAYWDERGLLSLYARIAFRLGARALGLERG